MIYDPRRHPKKSKCLDERFEAAERDVTEVLGEGWWRYKRQAKEAELRSLLANLAACPYADDKHDEVGLSRDKNDYRRRRKRWSAGRGYAITIPLVDALLLKGWCVMRLGYHGRGGGRSYRSRLLPTSKVFIGRIDHALLGCPDERPTWEVRDDAKMPIPDYEFTEEERAQIAELEAVNAFMEKVLVEVPAPRLVVETAYGRVRNERHIRDKARLRFHVPLDEVLACGEAVVGLFCDRSGFAPVESLGAIPPSFPVHRAFCVAGQLPPLTSLAEVPAPTPEGVVTADEDQAAWTSTVTGPGGQRPDQEVTGTVPLPEGPEGTSGHSSRRIAIDRSANDAYLVYGAPVYGGQYSVFFPWPCRFEWENPVSVAPQEEPHLVPIAIRNRRVFNRGTTAFGGRHYNNGQGVPRADRHEAMIGREETVELDFKGLHLTMCYHLVGLPAPADPYHIFGDYRDALARPVVKRAVLILINAKNERKVLPALVKRLRELTRAEWIGFEAFRERVEPLSDLLARIRRVHAPVAQFFNSDVGVRLQRLDSEIMRLVQNRCMALGIAVIPIHDSVVVARRHELLVERIMRDAYSEVMNGWEIAVERK